MPRTRDDRKWAAVCVGSLAAILAAEPTHAQCETDEFVSSTISMQDTFGEAVDIDGDFAVVGASQEDTLASNAGAAFIFRRQPDDTWLQVKALTASDGMAEDWFGSAVGISGEFVIVGAFRNDGVAGNAGKAYIYQRHRGGADNWGEAAILTAYDGAQNDWFGRAVDISGDTAIVSAWGRNVPAVYFFERNAGGLDNWGLTYQRFSSDIEVGDQFGFSVAIDGDNAIVGAVFTDDACGGGACNSGSAYIFNRNQGGVGNWGEVRKLNASDDQLGDEFGYDVAIDNDTAVVGAWREDETGIDAGAAYVFQRDLGGANNWAEVAKLAMGLADDRFGWSVAVSQDSVLVGSPFDDEIDTETGAAFLYLRDEGGTDQWGFRAKLIASDASAFERYGKAVALSGAVGMVGNGEGDEVGGDSGSVYAYIGIQGADCNANGVADACDIFLGNSPDLDMDGVPDECVPGFVGEARWINAAGGFFDDPLNWNPDVPGLDNPTTFDLDAMYTIIFDMDAASSEAILRDGDVTFDLGGFNYDLGSMTNPALIVAESAGEIASLALDGGSLTGLSGRVGSAAGSTGTLSLINGALASFQENLCIGCFGDGTLNVDALSTINAEVATIGADVGSIGVANVEGLFNSLFLVSIDHGTLSLGPSGQIVTGFFGVLVSDDGQLDGDGIVDASVVNFGAVLPGQSGVGTLTVAGDYNQIGQFPLFGDGSGRLHATLGGTSPGVTHDQLVVQGIAMLGGGLVVDFEPAFDPLMTDTFDVLTAPDILGAFDVALFPGLDNGRFLRMQYVIDAGPDNVRVLVDSLSQVFSFGDPTLVGLSGKPSGAVKGDFDNLNGPDVAVLVPNVTPGMPGDLIILLNGGVSGTWNGFTSSTQTPVGVDPAGLDVGDFNGDGHTDVAVTNAGDGTVTILLNDMLQTGTFQPLPLVLAAGTNPRGIAVAKLGTSLDTMEDLAVVSAGDGSLRLFTGDGSGGFVETQVIAVTVGSISIEPEDLDNDKCIDLVLSSKETDEIQIVKNLSGTLSANSVIAVGDGPNQLSVRDYNQDGLPDIISGNELDGTVSVSINQGSLAFSPAVNLDLGVTVRSLTGVDLEDDGDTDVVGIVERESDGALVVRVLRNDLTGGQLIFADAEERASGMDPAFVLEGDVDGNGIADLITVNEGVIVARSSSGVEIAEVGVHLNITNNCPTDTDASGDVGIADFLAVLAQWGPCPLPCSADTDDSGDVGIADFLAVLADWGPCP